MQRENFSGCDNNQIAQKRRFFMASPTLENLRQTLRNIRRRRSRVFILQHVSIALIAVTLLTLLLSTLEAWLSPSRNGDIALFFLLLAGIATAVWYVLRQIGRMQSDDQFLAHYVEGKIPDLEQRLLTSLEFSAEEGGDARPGVSRQFVRQLWLDAEVHVQEQQQRVDAVVSTKNSWVSAGTAAAVVLAATGTLLLSDVLLSSAGRLFWPFGSEPLPAPVATVEVAPDISIAVEPGNISMQRGDSASIVARVTNASPSEIQLRIQTDNVNWQDLTMPPVAATVLLTATSCPLCRKI
jgi:hypothetical protein